MLSVNISKLCIAFGGNEVIKDLDLDVQEGEFLVLLGPSGCGKSTLLHSLAGLIEIGSGSIGIGGRDMTYAEPSERGIGMVFQSFNLYPHMTALQNVTLALRRVQKLSQAQAVSRAMLTLDQVGLAHKIDAYPSQLSGGQQQRVAIARALALEPKIMLFDEPTSALDPELVGGVLAVMREVSELGMTMLVVSHEMRFARGAADRVIFMDEGRIVEQGPPEFIFESSTNKRLRDFLAALTDSPKQDA